MPLCVYVSKVAYLPIFKCIVLHCKRKSRLRKFEMCVRSRFSCADGLFIFIFHYKKKPFQPYPVICCLLLVTNYVVYIVKYPNNNSNQHSAQTNPNIAYFYYCDAIEFPQVEKRIRSISSSSSSHGKEKAQQTKGNKTRREKEGG